MSVVYNDSSTDLQDFSDPILGSSFPIWPRFLAEHFVPTRFTDEIKELYITN